MSLMLVTFGVLQPERSSEARLEHPQNILLILVAREMSSPERSIDAADESSANKPFAEEPEAQTPSSTFTLSMLQA